MFELWITFWFIYSIEGKGGRRREEGGGRRRVSSKLLVLIRKGIYDFIYVRCLGIFIYKYVCVYGCKY